MFYGISTLRSLAMVRSCVKMRWILLVALALLTAYDKVRPRKRVCVIGAGMAGVTAIKQLSDFTDEFEPIAFEKNSDVGGLWIYTDETDFDKHGLPVHSRVYKNSRTNLPKEIMTYFDYPQFTGREDRSFVSHEMVLEYIRNYTDHFDIRQYIQFDTLVKKVIPIKGDGDWTTEKWRVQTRNLKSNQENEVICEAVMVCNGHNFKPNVPKILGIESFSGRVLHSSAYRTPESFANQTVVVLGAGVSGEDISIDLSNHSKTVYLSHRHKKIPKEYPNNLVQVAGVVAANGSRVILQDNTSIIADAFMYCTGYSYDFPFLDESSGIYVEKGNVRRLYKMIVNVEHPTMAFIGLPNVAVFTLLHSVQSKYFVTLLQGKVQVPNYVDTKISGVPSESLMFGKDKWSYMNDLAREAGFEKVPLFYERGFELQLDLANHFADNREFDLRIVNENEVVAVRRRDGKTGARWQDFLD